MKTRLYGALKTDMLFQFRSGFHLIYVVLTLIYILVIVQLPESWRSLVAPFMIFSDPTVLGFFFVGGLVMLEKEQGIIDLVMVSPLRIREYLMAKVLSLNIISLVAGTAIAIVTGVEFNLLLLFLAITVTATFFTLLGFLLAIGSRSINQYFGKAIGGMMVIVLPCFSLVGFQYSWIFYTVPSVSAAKIFLVTFGQEDIKAMIACLIMMVLWNVGIFKVVENRFKEYSIQGGV